MSQFWIGATITAVSMIVSGIGLARLPGVLRGYAAVEAHQPDKTAVFVDATTRFGWAVVLMLAGIGCGLVGKLVGG